MIKYRSWNNETNKFFYFLDGKYYSDISCSSLSCVSERICSDFTWSNAEKSTGIEDKNNKEIYAGDIDISGMTVSSLGDQNEGLGMNVGFYLQRGDFESWIELESRCNFNGDNYEIKGNIHESCPSLDKSQSST